MIVALLFLILFAILFPKALRLLFALLFIGGIMILGEVHAEPAFSQTQAQAEFRAMGECLAWQVRTRGWVGHGPKDRINALYNEYAETCFDKIKPTAFDDPDHPDGSRAMYTYTGAEWFACHVDDYSAPNRDDEPMTCTDPSTQAYVERIVGSENVKDSSVPDNTKKGQASREDIDARNDSNPLDETDCADTLWIWGNMLQWESICTGAITNPYVLGRPKHVNMSVPGDGIKECLHLIYSIYGEKEAIRIVDHGKSDFNRNTSYGAPGQTAAELRQAKANDFRCNNHLIINGNKRSYELVPSDWAYDDQGVLARTYCNGINCQYRSDYSARSGNGAR